AAGLSVGAGRGAAPLHGRPHRGRVLAAAAGSFLRMSPSPETAAVQMPVAQAPRVVGPPGGTQDTPETLLARFGLERFRPGQREAVQAALDGRDSLVVMPTGGGKSLCYQLPALATGPEPGGDGLVVVVSPLIALMADQWRRLQQAGVHGVMLAS